MGNHTDKNLNTFSLRSTYTVISTQQSCNKDGSIYTDQTFILRHKHVIAIKKHIKRISASKHIFELYCFDVAVILSGVCLISIFENICNVFFVFYSQICPLGERILSGFFFLIIKAQLSFSGRSGATSASAGNHFWSSRGDSQSLRHSDTPET